VKGREDEVKKLACDLTFIEIEETGKGNHITENQRGDIQVGCRGRRVQRAPDDPNLTSALPTHQF
jgi:hypothetical protein